MTRIRSIGIRAKRWIVLGFFVLSPSVARGECPGTWDLSGAWVLTQNNGATLDVSFQQHGKTIRGSAIDRSSGGSGPVEGTFVSRHNFRFSVTWTNGTAGEYSGNVDGKGTIGGGTYDKANTASIARWDGDRQANCSMAPQLCDPGLVWRERFEGDTLCVKPDERYRLADGTCRSGYVWRDSFDGDKVCVTPAERDAAARQKRLDETGVVKKAPPGFDPNK